ncbi:MAG: hypothetical protein ACRC1M_08120 [Methanobacteriaceae archaeon]
MVNAVDATIVKDKITFDKNYKPVDYDNNKNITIIETDYESLRYCESDYRVNFCKEYGFKDFSGTGLKAVSIC